MTAVQPRLSYYDDDADAFLTGRKTWVSDRVWNDEAWCDRWIFMPSAQYGGFPTKIECDGYGLVAFGPADGHAGVQDSTTGERLRLYSQADLEARIEEIEEWMDLE